LDSLAISLKNMLQEPRLSHRIFFSKEGSSMLITSSLRTSEMLTIKRKLIRSSLRSTRTLCYSNKRKRHLKRYHKL
jgi:hypothetical protein